MQYMGLNEIREKYLDFFENKGHLKMPSFSLVPQGDKSLLLINAGMAPLKKYFTGEMTPPRTRVTTCQKCIRTPDIERVGITARHGTYFEMLGNFSFGDYFKREAINWAWEFCTEVMKMPVERLHVTVYLDDDEAYDIWTKEIGVATDHISRMGKEDNFWEHGAGPCGPCSEIYFDRGENYGCGKPDCKVGCDCDRYTEFWNLVFTQFENDGNNNYTRLKNCNIDTGMGLERLACIMQGVDNLFEVDTVQNIMKHIIDIAGVKYHENEKKDISLRVITDHIRSSTFMIGDGVMPSNNGRGYVLRRLLRRAARHGRLLGIEGTFLYKVCETVIGENANAYPNLVEKKDLIVKVIKSEEESFNKTIDTGLTVLEDIISKTQGNVLSGADAFRLQDTYGFPIDLTKELLEERNMQVDIEEYNRLSAENRAAARAARKDAGAEAWKDGGVSLKEFTATDFKGYDNAKCEGKIQAIIVDGEKSDFVTTDIQASIVLDKTVFYAESGGQAGDTGTLTLGDTVFEVSSTTKTGDGIFLHTGRVVSGESLSVGDNVTAEYDMVNRLSTARNHTGAHLLQAALREILGGHVEQAGQLVNSKAVRFDFTHFSALTREELDKVENRVNEIILSGIQVNVTEMPIDEAKKLGAMALFGEKYGDIVRVVRAGNFSVELCGGTHIDNTAKIGLFKIVSESSVAAGVRRIEAVTGSGVLEYIASQNALLTRTAQAMKVANISEIDKRALSLVSDIKAKDKEMEELRREIASLKIGDILKKSVDINGLKVICAEVADSTVSELRNTADMLKNDDGIVALLYSVGEAGGSFVCACGKKAISAGAHAGNIVRKIASLAGGSGGGKPDQAAAGTKSPDMVEKAVSQFKDIVDSFINS